MKPGGASTMPAPIMAALLINLVAFTLLYAYFVARRTRLLARQQQALA